MNILKFIENHQSILVDISIILIVFSLIKAPTILKIILSKDFEASYKKIKKIEKLFFINVLLSTIMGVFCYLFYPIENLPETTIVIENNVALVVLLNYAISTIILMIFMATRTYVTNNIKEELTIIEKLNILKESANKIKNKEESYFEISNGEIIYKDVINLYNCYLNNYIDIINIVLKLDLEIDFEFKKQIEITLFDDYIKIKESIDNLSNTDIFKEKLKQNNNEVENIKKIILEFANKQNENKERENLQIKHD